MERDRRRAPSDPRNEARDAFDPELRARRAEYWRRNVRYVALLLVVWFTVSFGFGIVLAEPLDRVDLPGTGVPLGFWFAQQGSIYVFVVLIFTYVWLMNRLDRAFDVDEAGPSPRPPRGGVR